jgi:hypothetical protein
LLAVAFAIPARCQSPTTISVTGNTGVISGGAQPYAAVSIQLYNCAAPATIPNLWVLVQTSYTLQADANGNVTGSVWPNNVISCGGVTGSSQYRVTYLVNGVPAFQAQCYSVLSTQGTWNLNSQQPVKCILSTSGQTSLLHFPDIRSNRRMTDA